MKSWQSILINACVTALVVFAVTGLFSSHASPDKTMEIRKALSKQGEALGKQMDGIQVKLGALEEAISKQNKQASLTTAPSKLFDTSRALTKLNGKLDMVLGKLAAVENADMLTREPQTFGRSFAASLAQRQMPPALSTPGRSPSKWIDELPEDKQQEVKMILEESMIRLREKLPPPDPGGRLPDRETVMNAVKENNELLKQELKSVLSAEEYQRFLDSHPEPVPLPAMPGGIQKSR